MDIVKRKTDIQIEHRTPSTDWSTAETGFKNLNTAVVRVDYLRKDAGRRVFRIKSITEIIYQY